MKKILALIGLAVLLSGCDVDMNGTRDSEKEYEWAVEFCGDKDNIQKFLIGSDMFFSNVQCLDGRYASVPVKYTNRLNK